jgi:hypothetical protein
MNASDQGSGRGDEPSRRSRRRVIVLVVLAALALAVGLLAFAWFIRLSAPPRDRAMAPPAAPLPKPAVPPDDKGVGGGVGVGRPE